MSRPTKENTQLTRAEHPTYFVTSSICHSPNQSDRNAALRAPGCNAPRETQDWARAMAPPRLHRFWAALLTSTEDHSSIGPSNRGDRAVAGQRGTISGAGGLGSLTKEAVRGEFSVFRRVWCSSSDVRLELLRPGSRALVATAGFLTPKPLPTNVKIKKSLRSGEGPGGAAAPTRGPG